MAIICGCGESEKELLNLYPKSVKKIGDIDKVKQGIIESFEDHVIK